MDAIRRIIQMLLQKLCEKGLEGRGRKIDDGQGVQVKEEEVGVRWLALAPKLAWREHTVPFRKTQ